MENDDSVLGSWDWNRINNYDRWRNPSVVVYPLSIRWLKENKMNILDWDVVWGEIRFTYTSKGSKLQRWMLLKALWTGLKLLFRKKGMILI